MSKAWLGVLGVFGAGLGIGFLAGSRYGQEKAKKDIPEKEEQKAEPIVSTQLEQTVENAEKIAEEQHYIPNEPEDDMEAVVDHMDAALAEMEAPSDDEEEEDHKKAIDELIEVFFDEKIWNEEIEYSCIKLYYYTDDYVIADEDERRIEDPEDLIGTEAIPTMLATGAPVIFVRNDWDRRMYKIQRIENSYGSLVLGLDYETMDEEE